MKRLPLSVLVMVVCASVLGVWMALEGLHLRLFGEPLSLFGASGPTWRLLSTLSVEPPSAAWPLVTVGTAWVGAVCAVLIKLSGIRRMVLILGLLSVPFVLPGSILGAAVLICLWIPATRAWLSVADRDAKA